MQRPRHSAPPVSTAQAIAAFQEHPWWRRVAECVRAGQTNAEIETTLHLKQGTAKNFLRHKAMYGALRINNRAALADLYGRVVAEELRTSGATENTSQALTIQATASWARRQESPQLLREIGANALPLAFWPAGWPRQGGIDIRMMDDPPFIPTDVEPVVADLIENVRQARERQNQPNYNSVVARVDALIPADEGSSPPLRIDIGRVDYQTNHALSQHLDSALPSLAGTIRDAYLREMVVTGGQFPATIGANVFVISADNKVVLAKRSGMPHTFGGCYAGTSGGFAVIEWPSAPQFQGRDTDIDPVSGKLDLYHAALRELGEEAVLHLDRNDLEFFLVTLNPQLANIDIYGMLQLETYAGEIATGDYLSKVLSDSDEIEQFAAVDFSEEGLRKIWSEPWVPEDKAAMVYTLIRNAWCAGDRNASRTVLQNLLGRYEDHENVGDRSHLVTDARGEAQASAAIDGVARKLFGD